MISCIIAPLSLSFTHHFGLLRLNECVFQRVDMLVVPFWIAKVGHEGNRHRDVDGELA